jgi:flavodoxin
MKSIIVLHSYHHNNTRKVAEVIANEIGSNIFNATDSPFEEVNDAEIIGFGAGIDSGHHYDELLNFARDLPNYENKKCFIFSTSAVQGKTKVYNDHKKLREILLSKGFVVLDEFSCKGFNTNLFLKYFGGMNKTRPNQDDLNLARLFAKNLV